MKISWIYLIFLCLSCLLATPCYPAVTKTVWGDAPTREYVFIENDTDDNFFVTPGGVLDPRMTGSNRWTGLKYSGSGTKYQESLGYIDNGYNTLLLGNWRFDMWLENSPVSQPLRGLRCINWYSGCDMNTSMIPPQATDAKGFYGVIVPTGDAKWMHGMMSDQFYQYLNATPVGSNFTMTINTCQTRESYNAIAGQRCRYMGSGYWYVRKVSYTKAAHLKLYNTNALSEVFIDSDGRPTLGEGNSECNIQVLGGNTGVTCKMMSYTLNHNGLNNSSIRIFPAINHPTLAAAIKSGDMQFSIDGRSWKNVSGITNYYSFNDMKGRDSLYIFLSGNFFKTMVNLGISDTNTHDLFNFRVQNITAPESGWYEFSPSAQMVIKPRDFSVSIISKDYMINPHRTGAVGRAKPALDFDYIVTTNGKTAADEVMVQITGPTQNINGRPWCIFSSDDGLMHVPFPASLIFTTKGGVDKTYDVGCDGQWRDITDALWITTPWTDTTGVSGVMNKSNVKFSIAMDSPESLNTVNQTGWYGDVSASGEIRIKATWKNVP